MAWNPYLDEWRAAHGDTHSWLARASNPAERGSLTEAPLGRFALRSLLVAKYAFAVPSEEALETIARYAPIVELGAGTGYWARCLRERGVDVVAYDALETAWREWFRPLVTRVAEGAGPSFRVPEPDPERTEPEMWTEVLPGGPRMLQNHPDRTLLLCWPDYSTTFAERALRAHQGRYVVYVGEGRGGCTATAAYFEELDRRWEQVDEASIPQWDGIRDRLTVHRRRERPARLRKRPVKG